jgi:hypothetical protein
MDANRAQRNFLVQKLSKNIKSNIMDLMLTLNKFAWSARKSALLLMIWSNMFRATASPRHLNLPNKKLMLSPRSNVRIVESVATPKRNYLSINGFTLGSVRLSVPTAPSLSVIDKILKNISTVIKVQHNTTFFDLIDFIFFF